MIHKSEFETIYQEYHPKVYRLCLGYVSGDVAWAQDLAQEVFIRLWEKQESIKDLKALPAWIYRVSFNTCMLGLRNKKRMPEAEMEDIAYSPEDKTEASEGLQQIYRAIDGFKAEEKQIALLLLEGMENENIADILEISKVNARVKIHRLRSKLKKALQS
jgi:RNA polymerase sigma-70 factor (ECF subfamily)